MAKKQASKSEGSMSETDWLRVTLDRMQKDVDEIKADVKMLRESHAETRGKVMILAAFISVVVEGVAFWFRH